MNMLLGLCNILINMYSLYPMLTKLPCLFSSDWQPIFIHFHHLLTFWAWATPVSDSFDMFRHIFRIYHTFLEPMACPIPPLARVSTLGPVVRRFTSKGIRRHCPIRKAHPINDDRRYEDSMEIAASYKYSNTFPARLGAIVVVHWHTHCSATQVPATTTIQWGSESQTLAWTLGL